MLIILLDPKGKQLAFTDILYNLNVKRSTYQDKDLGDKEFTILDKEFVRNDFNVKLLQHSTNFSRIIYII